MSLLPESWGLTTEKRSDGKLDIVGKTDAGESYKVRTTDGPEVTQTDLDELHDADRETYRNRDDGARTFVNKLVTHGKQLNDARESEFYDDLTEAAGPVVHAALETRNLTFGSTRRYRQNFDKVVWEE